MPKKKPSPAKPKAEKHAFDGFVNFYLTKTDKDAIGEHVFTAQGCLDFVNEMLEAGYAFKVAYDDYSDCPAVMMIGERTKVFNKGKIMSARHADLLKAFTILYYQHVHLSQSEDWDKEEAKPFDFDW